MIFITIYYLFYTDGDSCGFGEMDIAQKCQFSWKKKPIIVYEIGLNYLLETVK